MNDNEPFVGPRPIVRSTPSRRRAGKARKTTKQPRGRIERITGFDDLDVLLMAPALAMTVVAMLSLAGWL